MKLAGFYDEFSWLRIFARFHFGKSRNCWNTMKKIFCLSVYFKIRKFIFRQSESCVLTMSSWSRRVKIRRLKSSTVVQLPMFSEWQSEENAIFLLVYEFHELLVHFHRENRRKRQHCDHRSLFPSPSRVTSPLLRRLECVAWRIVASHCATALPCSV